MARRPDNHDIVDKLRAHQRTNGWSFPRLALRMRQRLGPHNTVSRTTLFQNLNDNQRASPRTLLRYETFMAHETGKLRKKA